MVHKVAAHSTSGFQACWFGELAPLHRKEKGEKAGQKGEWREMNIS